MACSADEGQMPLASGRRAGISLLYGRRVRGEPGTRTNPVPANRELTRGMNEWTMTDGRTTEWLLR